MSKKVPNRIILTEEQMPKRLITIKSRALSGLQPKPVQGSGALRFQWLAHTLICRFGFIW